MELPQEVDIREVWASNLEDEMAIIRDTIEKYTYIAMVCPHSRCGEGANKSTLLISTQDTEFPGIVARPIGSFRSTADYHYQTLRCNVDLLKIIQLGLTFTDENGDLPAGPCTWQFNFKFNLKYAYFC